jgi:transposase-like protein
MGKRYFSPEIKLEAIQGYESGESLKSLGDVYGVRPTLIHQWVMFYRRRGVVGLRGPGRPSQESITRELVGGEAEPTGSGDASAQRRIALLEQKIAQQALEIDFFKHALRHFETVLPPADRPGAPALIPSSGIKRDRKAD